MAVSSAVARLKTEPADADRPAMRSYRTATAGERQPQSHTRASWQTVALVLAMVVVAGGIVAGQRLIASSAFDRLDAATIAESSTQFVVALSYETRLLYNYGATNSIWDDSYEAVAKSSPGTLAEAFPPHELVSVSGVSGVVGVDSAGNLRVGGLVAGGGYTTVPRQITPALLKQMFPFDAAADAGAGEGRCGVVRAEPAPLLYCGFPARRSEGTGRAGLGLIFLRALDGELLTSLSKSTGIQLALTQRGAGSATDTGSGSAPRRSLTQLGQVLASTRLAGPQQIVLDIDVPTLDGGGVRLTSPHGRPIHATDQQTALLTFLLMGAGLLVISGLVLLLVRRSSRTQVEPLRRTTEKIIASGDHSLRLPGTGHREISGLVAAINQLLGSIETQGRQVAQAQEERERRLAESFASQQRTELQARERAQGLVSSAVSAVLAELEAVRQHASDVRHSAETITAGAHTAGRIGEQARQQAADADTAVAVLTDDLTQVHDITRTIHAITHQTELLALNARIEAARAGDSGAGFQVVAHEVRGLAASTADSATQIDATVGQVSTATDRVVQALLTVTQLIGQIDGAARDVDAAARDQGAVVTQLEGIVDEACARIAEMSRLGDDLERRDHPRLPVFAQARAECAGSTDVISVRDVSNTGLEVEFPARPGLDLRAGLPLRVHLPQELSAATLEATVMWTRQAPRGVLAGLRLADPEAGYLAAVQRISVELAGL